jgi:hypothetical protein
MKLKINKTKIPIHSYHHHNLLWTLGRKKEEVRVTSEFCLGWISMGGISPAPIFLHMLKGRATLLIRQRVITVHTFPTIVNSLGILSKSV